ncbi:MAG: hypothetical protein BGO55_24885 [Sphingobacteriales bacterium 50-39]|nr:hypothetical protein [Sphingobacteriales bacterium]OJW58522.1 MAG: hypothetical protein BGO55_24885 [Sphingobacteriales bacterium 50-39]
MKKILFIFLASMLAGSVQAQMTQQEMQKLKELSPDHDLKPPVKDLKRLSKMPLAAPSLAELSTAVSNSRKQLESIAAPAIVQEVKTMTSQQTPAQLQSISIGQWINNNPVQAMLLSMTSALKSPQEPAAWNNLAALYNMIGLEQKAVPILRYWLEKMPDNPLLLNNMGQAYLGMGDIEKATHYLQQCLTRDELNPEANHSMGMIAAFSNEVEKAMEYFSKELQVAYRRSTLGQIKRMGRSVNLLALREKSKHIPHKDLFTEIGLSKFQIPRLPMSAEEGVAWDGAVAGLRKSLNAEYFFWMNAGKITDEQSRAEGGKSPGLYADLADQLFSEHGDKYAHLLGPVKNDQDVAALTEMTNAYAARMNAVVCPTPPSGPNVTEAVIKAYQKKCCDIREPIVDAYMREYNGLMQARLNEAIANWKSYINGMVDIARLDPNTGNKLMVYQSVAAYFGFLLGAISPKIEPLPMECMVRMTSEEADAIIEASHNIELNCPSWLNIKLDLSMLRLSADCNKYGIEGGEGLMGGYEKNFKTGVATLSVGAGIKANFGAAKAGAVQMVYISFDNNDQMTDIGIRGSAGGNIGYTTDGMITETIGKVGATLAGVEGGYSLGLESGFKATLTGKGVMKDFIKLETSL